MPSPAATDRRVGARPASRARGRSCGRPTRHCGARVSTRAMDRARRALAGMLRCSSPERALLQLRQLELTEEFDLVLEPDAELLVRAPAGFGHERNRVGSRRG